MSNPVLVVCPPAYEHYEACPDPDRCGERAHAVLDDPDDGPRVLGHRKPCIASPSWGSCHSFVRAGFWVFLDDTAHTLAGRTVAMVPLPDWLVR